MASAWDVVARSSDRWVGVTVSRRELTTSTVVGVGGDALLIDPAWEPDELAWIADSLVATGISVAAGFATHAHHDHVLWHPALGAPPRWASRCVASRAAAGRADLVAALGPQIPAEIAVLVGKLTAVDGGRLPWDRADIELITHDAHAPGHTALWLPDCRVLIAGDMLSDAELPLLEESTVADYDNGLNALRPYAVLARVVVPGHGRPAIGRSAARARWTADRRYVDALIDGSDPTDDRINQPGMRKAHRDNVSRTHGGER